MAAESVSNLTNLLKEVWTQDRLERQFYDGTRFLDKVERTNKYTIGRQAQVPIEYALPGGTSTTLASGSSSLNASAALNVDRADYKLSFLWQQVALETAAMAQADSVGVRSTVDAVDQTVTSNVLALRKELNRQVVGNQDALIAQCTSGGASTTVNLLSTGYGYDAIVRGWLRPGLSVDIGTTASQASIVGGSTISAVAESSSAPTITIGSSVSTTSANYVSIANNRSGTTSNETNGLRNISGSATSVVGTLDPATHTYWQPAKVDTTTTAVTLDLLLTLQQTVYQKTGAYPQYVTTSPYQAKQLYALFQSQVRFDAGDGSTGAGNVSGFKWNGMDINPDPDIPNRELYLLDLPSFLVVTDGKFGKPTWVSDIEGAGGRLRWKQGTTQFVDAITYPLNLAIKRRNSSAAAIGLTA